MLRRINEGAVGDIAMWGAKTAALSTRPGQAYLGAKNLAAVAHKTATGASKIKRGRGGRMGNNNAMGGMTASQRAQYGMESTDQAFANLIEAAKPQGAGDDHWWYGKTVDEVANHIKKKVKEHKNYKPATNIAKGVAGVAGGAILGYGAYKAYKHFTKKPEQQAQYPQQYRGY